MLRFTHMVSRHPSVRASRLRCPRLALFARGRDSYRSGCPSSLCSSSHDGVSRAMGNAPGPLFMLEDGRPLSRAPLMNWLTETDLDCDWHSGKAISQAIAFAGARQQRVPVMESLAT